MLQLLIFAALAAFVLFRLYTVLGRRVGRQAPPAEAAPMRKDKAESASETLRPAFTGPGAAGMEAIRRADGVFDPDEFLKGARGAYEMIVQAFADGDRQTLRRFLAQDVYERYEKAIEDREAKGLTQNTDIVRIVEVQIQDAELDGRTAQVQVGFEAELSTVMQNAEGEVVEGDPARIRNARETWTFERDVKGRDPNWTLVKVSRG